jgi:hypothetical protein
MFRSNRLAAVAGLRYHAKSRIQSQQLFDAAPHQRMIVNDHDSVLLHHHEICSL